MNWNMKLTITLGFNCLPRFCDASQTEKKHINCNLIKSRDYYTNQQIFIYELNF